MTESVPPLERRARIVEVLRQTICGLVLLSLASGQTLDEIDVAEQMNRIRVKVTSDLSRLPNYTCLETIERSIQEPPSKRFQLLDLVRLEVALVDSAEMFAWPGSREGCTSHVPVPGPLTRNSRSAWPRSGASLPQPPIRKARASAAAPAAVRKTRPLNAGCGLPRTRWQATATQVDRTTPRRGKGVRRDRPPRAPKWWWAPTFARCGRRVPRTRYCCDACDRVSAGNAVEWAGKVLGRDS